MSIWADVHHGLRLVVRHKRFSALVIGTIGLAIGANVAVFQVLNLTMLRPLPFADADALFRVQGFVARPHGTPARAAVSPLVFARVVDAGVFEAVVAQRVANLVLRAQGEPSRVVGIEVSAGWTRLIGIAPSIGRTFTPDEEQRGPGAGAVLISDALWQRVFSRDPAVLGRTLLLDGRGASVIGVMPPAFNYPYHADLWLPMRLDPTAASPATLNVTGRLRAGAEAGEARARLRALSAQLAAENPAANAGRTFDAVSLREDLVRNDYRIVAALFGAVAFVLLIAAANVSSLLLTRGVVRRRDMAIRAALGATRARRFRALASESTVLAMLGGVFGAILALWSGPVVASLLPRDLHELGIPQTVDVRVVVFTLALTGLSACLIGLGPALRFSRGDMVATLRGAGRTTSSAGDRRLLGGLVVAEIAVALVLMVGAVQMLGFLRRIEVADPGFNSKGVLSLRVPVSASTLPSPAAFIARLLEELRGVPGIEAAGVTSFLPVGTANQVTLIGAEQQPPDAVPFSVNLRIVDGGYFGAIGIPLVAGRSFDTRDRASGDGAAIVSRALADRLWPGQDPVGRRVKRGRADAAAPWLTVVGVVGNTREQRDATEETAYLPFTQQIVAFAGPVQPIVVVRAGMDAGETARAARQAVARVDAATPVFQVATLDELQALAYAQERAGTQIVSVFAGAGLLLVVLGVYGLTAYAAAQRLHEIAIRMTFGAAASGILLLFLRQSAALALAGVAVGIGAAAILMPVLRGVIPGVDVAPAAAYAQPAGVLMLMTMLAALVPAWRATRIDPAVALRQ